MNRKKVITVIAPHRVIPLSSSKLSGCAPRSKRVECLEQIGVVIDPALNVCLQCNSEENESWYLFWDQKFFPPSVRSKCMYTSQEKSSSIWRLGRTFTTRVRNHTMVPLTFLLTLIFFPLEVNNVTRIYLFFSIDIVSILLTIRVIFWIGNRSRKKWVVST